MPSAEQTVLGCILRDNDVYWTAAQSITGMDFEDPRLGGVFDGMGQLIASGGKADAVTLEQHFPEWDVRGVSPAAPWEWLDAAVSPLIIFDAVKMVRSLSLRRKGRRVFADALEQLADTGSDPAQVLEQVNRQLVDSPRSSLDSTTLRDVLTMPDVQDWVIPGLMERKDRLILTGAEGLGKSTMARQLIILTAAGIHPFTSERIDPVTSLVVDAENTPRQWMRASRWMIHQTELRGEKGAADRVHLSLSGRLNILDPSTLGGIHRLIDKHKPDMVFIGPLYRLAVNMNRDDEIAPVIAALDTIRDRGVALVIEAHAGHALDSGGERSVRPRGSSALMGWPEFGYGVRRDRDNPEAFDFVAWRGAREERDWPDQLRRGVRELAEWPWMPLETWK